MPRDALGSRRPESWPAWLVHAYTASGTFAAFLAARAVVWRDYRAAFLWLFAAVVVDATDGWLARRAQVGLRLPQLDGRRLDDLVDYVTFVFVPALLVWRAQLVAPGWGLAVIAAMLLSSAYGFARDDAKAGDAFFTGFPSYWNVAALYLFVARLGPAANGAILLALAALVFVRIGYVYPTRTPFLRGLTLTLASAWGVLILAIVLSLPKPSATLVWVSLAFPAYYAGLSFVLHARRGRQVRTG